MIQSLAYLGFNSPNATEWSTFGPEVLGAELVDVDGAAAGLRVDDAAWRVAIHEADENDIAYIGWDVGDAAGLEGVSARLTAAGFDVGSDRDANADVIAARQVDDLAWITDPFGFRHEFTHGHAQAATPLSPGRAMQGGFVTGAGGMGHLVVIVPDGEVANDFYLDTLGFSHSDDVEAGVTVRFLHCNQRHHSFAFSVVPGMVGVHHFMLEVEVPDDVGRAYDIVNERDLPVAMSLGRHTNDEMFSFYVRTPSGFEVEYGSGGRLIDASAPWEPTTYDATSTWGHKPPPKRLFPGILRAVSV